MWAREPKDANGQRPGIKESTRWVEGYERVAELAAVAFAFAALGALTPGESSLLAAELGISLVATLLVAVSLGRSG